MRVARAIVARDLTLAVRAGGGTFQAVLFLSLAVIIYALAVGPDVGTLSLVAAPVLWASALLATIVSLDRVFQADFEDGSLDVLVETSDTLSLSVLAKAVSHWLSTGLPLVIAAPILGILLGLEPEGYLPVAASLAVGTPGLSLIGALAAAITVSLRRASILVTLLTAPLYAPVIIFGVGAAKAGAAGEALYAPSMLILAAISLFAAIVAPLAGAAAIRLNLD